MRVKPLWYEFLRGDPDARVVAHRTHSDVNPVTFSDLESCRIDISFHTDRAAVKDRGLHPHSLIKAHAVKRHILTFCFDLIKNALSVSRLVLQVHDEILSRICAGL